LWALVGVSVRMRDACRQQEGYVVHLHILFMPYNFVIKEAATNDRE